jgi:hypothetical protein
MGLTLSNDPPGMPLYHGEYAMYNCTDPTNNVTDWGLFFALQCVNGVIATPDAWPVCREPRP